MKYETRLLQTGFVTHNVRRYIFEKPSGYKYVSGQWTKIWLSKDEFRPFTYSSTPNDSVLEITVKGYLDRDGFTKKLWDKKPGEIFSIEEASGSIKYDGPGLFIAAGTGITPFLSIFRDKFGHHTLKDSILMYSNREAKDIICEKELIHYFSSESNKLHLTLTREDNSNYANGRLNLETIKSLCSTPNCRAYICGPRPFVNDMNAAVKELGISEDSIIFD